MSVRDHDDVVARRTRAQQVALFRYQLICPALDPGLSSKARGRIVRAIAAGCHAGPAGRTATPGTPWTGGSAATGSAGSMRWLPRCANPGPGSTPRCWSWRWR